MASITKKELMDKMAEKYSNSDDFLEKLVYEVYNYILKDIPDDYKFKAEHELTDDDLEFVTGARGNLSQTIYEDPDLLEDMKTIVYGGDKKDELLEQYFWVTKICWGLK